MKATRKTLAGAPLAPSRPAPAATALKSAQAKPAAGQFRLKDAATGRELTGAVRIKNGRLEVTVQGYGSAGLSTQPGAPTQPIVVLDIRDGRLTVEVWDDTRVQNGRRLDMEMARLA